MSARDMIALDRSAPGRATAFCRWLPPALLPCVMALAASGLAQGAPGAPAPRPAPLATAASTFDVTATVHGPVNSLWVELALKPLPADVGKVGKVFVGAWIPTTATAGSWFLHDGSGWTAWNGGPLRPYRSGTLGGREAVAVLQGLDVRAFPGTGLYMGYGIDGDDMLARGLVKLAHTIDGRTAPTPPAGFTLMSNPTDSAWLSVQGTDGSGVQYFGTRSSAGLPAALRRVEVSAADGGLTRIELDTSLRPLKLRAPNGSVFELSYVGGQQAQVQATSGDGSAQVSATFPLGAGAVPVQAGARPPAPRRRPLQAAAASDWTIQVNRCGMPFDDAEVTYSIQVPGQSLLAGAGMAHGVGGGRYVAPIPTGLKPSLTFENLRAAAESMADTLGTACDLLGLAGNPQLLLASMCPYIGGALTAATGAGGVAIGQACTVVTTAVASYCKVLGEGGVINEPSLAERILAGLKDPKVFQSVITLRADAYVKGRLGSYPAQISDVPANGPHASVLIAVDDGCGDLSTTNYAATRTAAFEDPASPYLRGFGVKGEIAVSADSVVRRYPDEPCCTTWWLAGGREFRVRLGALQVDTALFPYKTTHMGGEYIIHESARFVAVSGVHQCDGMPAGAFTGTEVTLPTGGSCSITFVVNMKETQTRYSSDDVRIESGVYATGLNINVEVNR